MSQTQTNLGDWQQRNADDAEDTATESRIDWGELTPCVRALSPGETVAPRPTDINPGDYESGGPHCQSCGQPVNKDYARVQGDNNDTIHECPRCPDSDMDRRVNGAAAGLDVQERKLTTAAIHQS